jgi:putative membrane protein
MHAKFSEAGYAALLGMAVMLTPSLLAQAVPGDPTASPGSFPTTTTSNGAVGSHTSPGVNPNGAMQTPPGGAPPVAENNGSIMQDKMFLRIAEQDGVGEVKLGQLAASKGGNEEVRKLGQKMVEDHTALEARLQPFVERLGVPVTKHLSKDDQAEWDKLNGLSGDDFNHEYLLFIRADHHKNLRAIRDELLSTQDPDLKDAVISNAKVLVEHTKLVDSLAVANGLPARGRPEAPKSDTPK